MLCELGQQQPLKCMKLMLPEMVSQPQEMEHEEQHSYFNTTCDVEQDGFNLSESSTCDAEEEHQNSSASTTCDVEQDGLNSSGSTTCDAEEEHQKSPASTTCDALKEEEEYCIPEQQEIFFVPCGNHNSPRQKRRKLVHKWSQASKQKRVVDGVRPFHRWKNVNHMPHKDKFNQAKRLVGSNKPNSIFSSPKHNSHVSELAVSPLVQPTGHSSALSVLNDDVPSTLSNTGPTALSTSTASHEDTIFNKECLRTVLHEDTIFNKEFLRTVLSLHSRYFSLDMRALLQIAQEVCNLQKMKSRSAMTWLSTIITLVNQTTNFDSIRDPSCFGAAARTPTMLMKLATKSTQVTEPCFLPKSPQFFFATLQFHLLEVGPSRLYCMDHARLPLQGPRAHPGQSSRPQTSGKDEQLLTTICCLNAAGDSVPPFLLLPSKLDQLSSSPDFSLTTASFCDWLQFFVSRSGTSPQQPTVLLVRGCQRFLHCVAAQRIACKAGLVLLSYPLHLPNAINPLPEFFLSLTAQFRLACDRWLTSNPSSRQLEQNTVASLYALSFKLAATQAAVMGCFRDAGLYPLVCLEKLHTFWKLVENKKRTMQSLQVGNSSKVDDNTLEDVSCSASEKALKKQLTHCNQQITGIVQNDTSLAVGSHPTDNNLALSIDLSDILAGSHLEPQTSGLASQQQPAVAVYRVRLPETHLRPRASVMPRPIRPVPGTIFCGPPSAQLTSQQDMALPAQSTGGQRMTPPLINTLDINSNKMSAVTPRTDSSCSSSFRPPEVLPPSSNSSSSVTDYVVINNKSNVVPENGTLTHNDLAKNAISKPQLLASVTKKPPSSAFAQDTRGILKVLRTHKSWDRGSSVLSGEACDRRLLSPGVKRPPGPFKRVQPSGESSLKSTSPGSRLLRNTARKRTRPTARATRYHPTRHLSTDVSCPVCLENTEEEWIQCMYCKAWVHELCADIRDPVFYYCDFCLLKHKERLVGVGGEGIRSGPSVPAPEPAKGLEASTLAGISAAIEAAIRTTCTGISEIAGGTDHGDKIGRWGSQSLSGDTDTCCADSEVCAKARPGSVCPSAETNDNSAVPDHGAETRPGFVCPPGDTKTCSANTKGGNEKQPDVFSNPIIGDATSHATRCANAVTLQAPFDSFTDNIPNTSDTFFGAPINNDSSATATTILASLAPSSLASTTTSSLVPTSRATTTTISAFLSLTSPATITTSSLASTSSDTSPASLAPTYLATTYAASLAPTSPLTTSTASLSPSSSATTATASSSPTSPSIITASFASASPTTTTADSLTPTSPGTSATATLAPTIVSTTTNK